MNRSVQIMIGLIFHILFFDVLETLLSDLREFWFFNIKTNNLPLHQAHHLVKGLNLLVFPNLAVLYKDD